MRWNECRTAGLQRPRCILAFAGCTLKPRCGD
jgi:hypothetical protein